MCAKRYENPTVLSKVTAKNVGDVFFETHCISPGFPGHIFFWPLSGHLGGFSENQAYGMSGFCTLKPVYYHKFIKVITKGHCIRNKCRRSYI